MGAVAIEITQVISPEGDPSGFEVLLAVYREDVAARDPGDPLPGPREVAAEMFGQPPDHERLVYAARVGGEPAGMAWATTMSARGDEIQLADMEILVRSAHRRRGVATAILRRAVPDLVDLGQTSLVAYPCADLWSDEALALCRRYGLTRRQDERCSRARVADVDDELLATWIAGAATRAAGYLIEQWEGPCPDHLIEQWCVAAAAMRDAPLDDLDYNPHTRDVGQQREADLAGKAWGFLSYRTLALSAGGDAAGMSEISLHRERPQVAHQGDTGVLAAHRGHGLGRWLKAANYRFVRRAHPELEVVETYNAESNPWMLDINIAMGFRPHHLYTAHQAPMATVVAALARS
jgi:GNAT superfamily N-acetyltransferase